MPAGGGFGMHDDLKAGDPVVAHARMRNTDASQTDGSDADAAPGRMHHMSDSIALLSLGYDMGDTGPRKDGVDGDWGTTSKQACAIFQRGRGLAATGDLTPETVKALLAAVAAKKDGAGQPGAGAQLPADWLPSARISRVIVHWTAGNHRASQLDRSHYHILIESDAKLIRGIPSIAMNDAGGVSPGYAAHTLNCNTGSIGVSLCCMAGAIESPFNRGSDDPRAMGGATSRDRRSLSPL
jgi:hypothetical protein